METFHQQRVLFEGIRLHATAQLECDEWGVSVHPEPETDRDPSPSRVLGRKDPLLRECGGIESDFNHHEEPPSNDVSFGGMNTMWAGRISM